MVRIILNIQLLFYGMTYLMNLEELPILTNLKTFYYLGMEINANVMHVKHFNIIKGTCKETDISYTIQNDIGTEPFPDL
jgi:hypothetical protein